MQSTRRVLLALTALSISATGLSAATTMTATPSAVSVTYVKGTGPGAAQTSVVKPAAGSIYVTVDTSLPNWLMVSPTNGTATSTAGVTLSFTASSFAASLGSGVYTGTVTLHANTGSTTAPDITVAVTLTVKNAVATIVPPAAVNISWTAGTSLPTASVLLESTGDPVTFSLSSKYTAPTTAWFSTTAPSFIAYSWGTTVSFSFVQSAFDNATIGKPLTGSVTITPSNGAAAITVNITVTVAGPTPTVTSVKPPKLPVVGSGTGTRTLAVAGTNFADGMNVHLNSGSPITNNCTTFAAAKVDALCIQSSTLLFVKITEATDLKNAGTLTVNVGSASGTVTVTTSPIVYAVTDAATFVEPASGNSSVSPYEIISIFGDNLSGSTVYGTVTSGRYANSLTDSLTHVIKVHFYKADGTTPLDHDPDAYLLIATPTQINLMVPSTLPSAGTAAAQMVVDNNSLLSDAVVLDVTAANPGFFTTDNGLHQAVAVLPDGSVNSSGNPAVQGANSFMTFYLAGLGAPNSAGATTDAGPALTCLSVANYMAAADATWVTVDGAVLDGTKFGQFNLPPCFTSGVSVTVGGVDVSSNVLYAGWVSGSVAGLYQLNLSLPAAGLTSATKVPLSGAPAGTLGGNPYYIKVTAGGVTSPDNAVYIYVK